MMELTGWITLYLLVVALFYIFFPWAVFASINLLFGLALPHSFLSYLSFWVLTLYIQILTGSATLRLKRE